MSSTDFSAPTLFLFDWRKIKEIKSVFLYYLEATSITVEVERTKDLLSHIDSLKYTKYFAPYIADPTGFKAVSKELECKIFS